MYRHYEERSRRDYRARIRLILAVLLAGALVALGVIVAGRLLFSETSRPVHEEGGVKTVSGVRGEHLAVYEGGEWREQFWNGMNLGATLPGHAPGELAPDREDYLRWFAGMEEMNVDVVRVYTILNPEFYRALGEFNEDREEPLWVIQGIWSPEEELIGEEEEGRDAYSPEITNEFRSEIRNAVRAVHGDADIEARPGHASGSYDEDISEYVLGWMVGTEWFPYAVEATDEANAGMEPYSGRYFRASEDATPFESWLARMSDTLAEEEMRYGWQHPVAITNWLTTDPLEHPNEPNPQEDLVSVDSMNVVPTEEWRAGYFASYHVYPYYPDFLSYEEDYQSYRAKDGEIDPYAGYLADLRAHHEGLPLVVGEFGVPSSRGMAHRGPLGRDQGHHTEVEQGRMNASMLSRIREEGYDGGLLFAWHDEWFKFTWNTADIDVPADRRPSWFNRLTNEQNFGVIAHEPGEPEDRILLDGETDDWERREAGPVTWLPNLLRGHDTTAATGSYDGFDLSVAHDEAYLYLLAEKTDGAWDFAGEDLTLGFGSLPGGSERVDVTPGVSYPGGIQTFLRLGGEGESRMYVNSAYDYHTWLYGEELDMTDAVEDGGDAEAGKFLPWRLALSRPVTLPETGEEVPFSEFEVGEMKSGVTDPSDPGYDDLADWYASGAVLEVRIPWTMLGYTNPSDHEAWDNLYENDGVRAAESDSLRVYPAASSGGGGSEVPPLTYSWRGWDAPDSHERRKKGFPILEEAFADKELSPR